VTQEQIAAQPSVETPAVGETTGASETPTVKGNGRAGAADVEFELARLVELATKYPEIGPPLAELAFKLAETELGNRIVRMGLERGVRGLEYFFVAANVARREGRAHDVLQFANDAVRAFADAEDKDLAEDDGSRLLHLVRLAFATLLFDVKDAAADKGFVAALTADMPRLEGRLGNDPFYRSLLAQTLWYADKQKSEEEWERAVALGDGELAWNARGTWYKEAEHDFEKACRAYRDGLGKVPRSALLHHNLAQVMLEESERTGEAEVKRKLLREADELLRAALREDAPKGLRRHIYSTRDRLQAARSKLPPREAGAAEEPATAAEPVQLPNVGDVVHGRVVSLTAYGAFLSVPGRGVGLLHKSEMAHENIGDPASIYKVGDDIEVKVLDVQVQDGSRTRIGLSKKALTPAPPKPERVAGAQAPRDGEARAAGGRGQGERGRGPRGNGGGQRDRRGGAAAGAGRGGGGGGGGASRGAGGGGGGAGRSEHSGRSERYDRNDQRPTRLVSGDSPRRDGDKVLDAKLASLGEMLLAKMREPETKS